jgi:D-alanine-D-alanine ligase
MTAEELKHSYIVWVLAPLLETDDPELQSYYDFTQSHGEYKKVFSEIGCEWHWVDITLSAIDETIDRIKNHPGHKTSVVINLCDGDELNGVPGLSVIRALNKRNIIYTGSDEAFYIITTSKIPMKEAFDRHRVPTAPWKVVNGSTANASQLFKEIGDVMIVKPAISAGSMGLGIKNVVDNEEAYKTIVYEMQNGYHGWKLDTGGLFVEEFIKGREFTTLVVGSSTNPSKLHCYAPVERVFHQSLPEKEKFLSYDRLWNMYKEEQAMPNEENLYEYVQPEANLVPTLQQISIDAFKSVGGMGYGRLDIRMNTKTGGLYVLEVNAQCGLSEDEDYTSIGAILRFAKKSFTYLIIEIIEDALMRHHVDTKYNHRVSPSTPVSPNTQRNTPL